jgi:hypothetical protein
VRKGGRLNNIVNSHLKQTKNEWIYVRTSLNKKELVRSISVTV